MANHDLAIYPERILLIALNSYKPKSLLSTEASLKELAQLAENAGGLIIDMLIVNREAAHPNHYLGKGKIDEVNLLIQEKEIDLVIIDDELSIRQQLQLDARLNCRLIDRTALILQIFADRAKTSEGKLQIELAQLTYLLPRLTGRGKEMSRLGGGIGTRGPGESQLEKDRRHIRLRIDGLKQNIVDIKKQRMVTRQQREKNQLPILTLVGYTNAGKSTLLNILTTSEELAEDKLFATLDPTTRRFDLLDTPALLTDTVGFIQQLPHSLITAFRATLEEATFSDLLIHVIDSSHPEMISQISTVNKVLKEIGCQDKPMLYVFNKIDQAADLIELHSYVSQHGPAVMISAKTGVGLDQLKKLLLDNLPTANQVVRFKIPLEENQVLSLFYQAGMVNKVKYDEIFITGQATISKAAIQRLGRYIDLKEESTQDMKREE
jgi:GTP-binding protein HflX